MTVSTILFTQKQNKIHMKQALELGPVGCKAEYSTREVCKYSNNYNRCVKHAVSLTPSVNF